MSPKDKAGAATQYHLAAATRGIGIRSKGDVTLSAA
jgi:hypothetical protein